MRSTDAKWRAEASIGKYGMVIYTWKRGEGSKKVPVQYLSPHPSSEVSLALQASLFTASFCFFCSVLYSGAHILLLQHLTSLKTQVRPQVVVVLNILSCDFLLFGHIFPTLLKKRKLNARKCPSESSNRASRPRSWERKVYLEQLLSIRIPPAALRAVPA